MEFELISITKTEAYGIGNRWGETTMRTSRRRLWRKT